MVTLSDAERAEDWRDRERRRVDEEEAERKRRAAEREHAAEARLARLRAIGCNDGGGVCRFCLEPLGIDSTGTDTHPDNGCPGPARVCAECGMPWVYSGKRWNPACTPVQHDERKRAAAWQLAVRAAPVNMLPPRVYKDDE